MPRGRSHQPIWGGLSAGELHHPSRTAACWRLPGTSTLSVASPGNLIDSGDYIGALVTPFPPMDVLASLCRKAAVDQQTVAGHERRLVGRKPDRRVGDLLM